MTLNPIRSSPIQNANLNLHPQVIYISFSSEFLSISCTLYFSLNMFFNGPAASNAYFNYLMLGSSPDAEISKNHDPLSNSCTSTYEIVIIDGYTCYNYNVTFTWVKYWNGHFLTMKIESLCDENEYQYEISLQSYLFKNSKGHKAFRVGKRDMTLFWDLKSAKYSGSPQPCSNYYTALVANDEIVLLLGDLKDKATNDTHAIPSPNEGQLVHATQNVCGKDEFSAKITLDQEHDISIKSCLLDSTEPEMWISVDGAPMVQVTKLNWRFRGNATVMLENMKLNILWDVHDWLFNARGLGQGLFIFESSSIGGHDLENQECQNSTLSQQRQLAPDSCFFLYAWKTD